MPLLFESQLITDKGQMVYGQHSNLLNDLKVI